MPTTSWTVAREGGEAERLTSVNSVITGPYFSPDGTQIAYSTNENGVQEVYVINSEGGVPRRVTWDPSGNFAVGWSADGKDVLFASPRTSYSDFFRLFRAHADATGSPTSLPLPSATEASYSPDGPLLPTSRSCNGKPRGSTIAAARPRRFGS